MRKSLPRPVGVEVWKIEFVTDTGILAASRAQEGDEFNIELNPNFENCRTELSKNFYRSIFRDLQMIK